MVLPSGSGGQPSRRLIHHIQQQQLQQNQFAAALVAAAAPQAPATSASASAATPPQPPAPAAPTAAGSPATLQGPAAPQQLQHHQYTVQPFHPHTHHLHQPIPFHQRVQPAIALPAHHQPPVANAAAAAFSVSLIRAAAAGAIAPPVMSGVGALAEQPQPVLHRAAVAHAHAVMDPAAAAAAAAVAVAQSQLVLPPPATSTPTPSMPVISRIECGPGPGPGSGSASLSPAQWEMKRTAANPGFTRDQMNEIVLDYLIREGFKEAAEAFAAEADMKLERVLLEGIDERLAIHNAILNDVKSFCVVGNILEAISMINDLNAELLDENADINFLLRQQHVIELIKAKDKVGALGYAQTYLSEHGDDVKKRQATEKTLMLLCFDDFTLCPVNSLLSDDRRNEVASEVNSAILVSQDLCSSPKLLRALQLLDWAQANLDELAMNSAAPKYPRLNDVTTGNTDYGAWAAINISSA